MSTERVPRWLVHPALIGIYLLVQGAFLVLLRLLSPRFMYLDDQQAQYLPMFWWMGRNLEGGRPPLLAPEQGAAGNLVADVQYGVYDPLHWLISWLVGQASDLNDAAWLLSSVPLALLGVGVLTVLRHFRVPAGLAVAASVGVASTGFLLWLGSAWWPLLWSTAWLPWLWYGLATRGRLGVLITAFSAYAIASSGYPYNLPVAAVLVAGVLGERWLVDGVRGLRDRATVARLVAGAAGLLAAAPGLLSAAQMLPAGTRSFAETPAGNPGEFVPNLADVLLGGSTLNVSIAGFWFGTLSLAPLAATAVFALPAAALVSWRTVAWRPGVPTAALLWAAAVVATQLPTHLGPFRHPWRYLTEVSIFLTVVVALGLAYGLTVTRRRLQLAGLLVALQLGLALSRSPRQVVWHLLAGLLALLAVAVLARGGVSAPAWPRVRPGVLRLGAAASLVLVTVGGAVLGERAATDLHNRYQAAAEDPITNEPGRDVLVRPLWPADVQGFRDHAVLDGTSPTIMTYGRLQTREGGWGLGVLGGNANLYAGLEPGFGYYAIGHQAWIDRSCVDRIGLYNTSPDCGAQLLETVPGTDEPWISLMAGDSVLMSPAGPANLRSWFDDSWRSLPDVGIFDRWERPDPLPGRVTATLGDVDALRSLGPQDRPAYAGQPLDTYEVTTGAGGGELVLRIPAWPGLEASVDGRPLEVGDIDGTLTVLRLPAGLDDAQVTLSFTPRGEVLLWPALGAGVLLALVAAALARPLRRPRTEAPPAARSARIGEPEHARADELADAP